MSDEAEASAGASFGAEISSGPEKPLGPLRPANPGEDEPPPKEWVGDIEVIDDEAD